MNATNFRKITPKKYETFFIVSGQLFGEKPCSSLDIDQFASASLAVFSRTAVTQKL